MELSNVSAWGAVLRDRATIAAEFLDAVITELADQEVAIVIETDSVGIVELTWSIPLFAEDRDQFGAIVVAGDDLDSMVASIGDPETIVFIDGDRLWAIEFECPLHVCRIEPGSCDRYQTIALDRILHIADPEST